MRFWERLKRAWRTFQDSRPATGCVIVRARIGNEWRDMKLTGVCGFHASAESNDDPKRPCIQLLTEQQIHPEDVELFRTYMARMI